MNNGTKVTSNELKKRVKKATCKLLSLIEKSDFAFVRYEKIPESVLNEMRIEISTVRITIDELNKIRDIISQCGLRITSIVIYFGARSIVVGITVTLE
jgi:pimeloyl-CoA synthetase